MQVIRARARLVHALAIPIKAAASSVQLAAADEVVRFAAILVGQIGKTIELTL